MSCGLNCRDCLLLLIGSDLYTPYILCTNCQGMTTKHNCNSNPGAIPKHPDCLALLEMIVALCYDYHAVIDVGMLCSVMYCAPCLCILPVLCYCSCYRIAWRVRRNRAKKLSKAYSYLIRVLVLQSRPAD